MFGRDSETGYSVSVGSNALPTPMFVSGLQTTQGYDSPSKEQPLSNEMDRMTKNIAEIDMALSALYTQLQPIMTPQPPQVAGAQIANAPSPLPRGVVVDGLRASNERLQDLLQKIAMIRSVLVV